MKQPIQPLQEDESGVIRFKQNSLVRYILDHGGIDMNDLAMQDFPQEDEEQFAQLIGYSLSGFGDLSYVTNDTYEAAHKMAHDGLTEEQARIAVLEEQIDAVRVALKDLVPQLFHIHEEDLVL